MTWTTDQCQVKIVINRAGRRYQIQRRHHNHQLLITDQTTMRDQSLNIQDRARKKKAKGQVKTAQMKNLER